MVFEVEILVGYELCEFLRMLFFLVGFFCVIILLNYFTN